MAEKIQKGRKIIKNLLFGSKLFKRNAMLLIRNPINLPEISKIRMALA
jgi:hypothetical protein